MRATAAIWRSSGGRGCDGDERLLRSEEVFFQTWHEPPDLVSREDEREAIAVDAKEQNSIRNYRGNTHTTRQPELPAYTLKA